VRAAQQPRRIDTRIRGGLLMPLCALAVHQLRYYMAFGSGAPRHLAHDGHAYLSTVEPFALLAAALALGALLGALVRTWPQASPRTSLVRIWAACAAALLAIYCAQELLEGSFASGHPAGLAGVVGHGGWIAVPAAVAIGGMLALTLRIADCLIAFVAARAPRDRAPRGIRPRLSAPGSADWRLLPLSGAVAGRAPPGALSPS
jgi:hypothetical protein